jgi:hypothetical protein
MEYGGQNVHHWYNPACLYPSAYGTVGDLGRNQLVGPGYVDTDLGVLKNTRINERINIQFRAELLNLWNHANFATPNATAFNAGSISTNYLASPSATAGQITSIVGNARQTQFSLKLLW